MGEAFSHLLRREEQLSQLELEARELSAAPFSGGTILLLYTIQKRWVLPQVELQSVFRVGFQAFSTCSC